MKRFILLLIFLISFGFSYSNEIIAVSITDETCKDLDLRSVAILFGKSESVEDFESKLNDPVNKISNLDLNGDGYIDYLRCVETYDRNSNFIVIQSCLAKDIFQDVAIIHVEKDYVEQTLSIKIIGDYRIYGPDYIIIPTYIYRPTIYNWFWTPYYSCWHSPYYCGHYHPIYYYRHCCSRSSYIESCNRYHRNNPASYRVQEMPSRTPRNSRPTYNSSNTRGYTPSRVVQPTRGTTYSRQPAQQNSKASHTRSSNSQQYRQPSRSSQARTPSRDASAGPARQSSTAGRSQTSGARSGGGHR